MVKEQKWNIAQTYAYAIHAYDTGAIDALTLAWDNFANGLPEATTARRFLLQVNAVACRLMTNDRFPQEEVARALDAAEKLLMKAELYPEDFTKMRLIYFDLARLIREAGLYEMTAGPAMEELTEGPEGEGKEAP